VHPKHRDWVHGRELKYRGVCPLLEAKVKEQSTAGKRPPETCFWSTLLEEPIMGIEEFAETPAILHELLEFRVRVITLSGRRVHVPKLFYQEKQHAEEGVGVKSHRVDARRCRTIVGGGANPNRAERSEQWVQSVSSSTFGPAVCVDNPFLKVLSYRRSRPPLAAYSLPRGRGGRRRAALTYVMSAWLRPLPERQVLATQNRDPSPPPRSPHPLAPPPPLGRAELRRPWGPRNSLPPLGGPDRGVEGPALSLA